MALLFTPPVFEAQSTGMIGDWMDPGGSVVRVDHCGAQICLWIISVSSSAPATTDMNNPEPRERTRALCGLMIGRGFVLRDPGQATNGTLYDPRTGKTYHGAISLQGTKLELRGYVGIPLLGESQTWIRPEAPVKACIGATPGNQSLLPGR
jgi:uncharacterized protein (DUF2147 family)